MILLRVKCCLFRCKLVRLLLTERFQVELLGRFTINRDGNSVGFSGNCFSLAATNQQHDCKNEKTHRKTFHVERIPNRHGWEL
jgi:hypothetical protein